MKKQFAQPGKAVVISDCRDDNARVRVTTRVAALFPNINVDFIGVQNDIEAAGCLVDVIDAALGRPVLILVNVAPRNGKHHRKNGSPFGYIQVGKAHIFGTMDGLSFSLLGYVAPQRGVRVYDTDEVVKYFGIPNELQEHIATSQFRSYEFLPRLAAHVLVGKRLHGKLQYPSDQEQLAAPTVWWVDVFGNAKLTVTAAQIGFTPGALVGIKIGKKKVLVKCYERLPDIPLGELGLTVGSSGFGVNRWLELMIKRGDAARALNLKIGQTVFIKNNHS